jgi:hypothetical protein
VNMNKVAYFHFTNAIKYLGSIVTSCLRDSIDITTHISKACGTIGALKEFFISHEAPLNIKPMLYLAIPLNTALWGCELCALLDTDTKALEVFHHRSIRRILGISMKRAREEKINNSEVIKRFHGIPTSNAFATLRTIRYIGKTVQNMKANALRKQLIAAFCHSPRHYGGQQRTHRDHFAESIRILTPAVSIDTPLKQ